MSSRSDQGRLCKSGPLSGKAGIAQLDVHHMDQLNVHSATKDTTLLGIEEWTMRKLSGFDPTVIAFLHTSKSMD